MAPHQQRTDITHSAPPPTHPSPAAPLPTECCLPGTINKALTLGVMWPRINFNQALVQIEMRKVVFLTMAWVLDVMPLMVSINTAPLLRDVLL